MMPVLRGMAAAVALAGTALARRQPSPAPLVNQVVPQPASNPHAPECRFSDAPVVLKQSGNAILQVWTVNDSESLSSALLPVDGAFLEYRRTLERAGADRLRPVADQPQPANESEREMWSREKRNEELAYSGRAGVVRPVRCLDALLFAYQNARYPQLSHPTEFIASILRQTIDGKPVLRIYFAASDALFPSKDYYGFEDIKKEISAGWEFWAMLHNHTIQRNNGAPALGVPALSSSDVDLLRSLAQSVALQNAWITNGFYTIVLPVAALDQYLGRP